jgi:DNA-binding response OmpR family regulator
VVALNPTEFRLLAYLAHHPGKVLSRDEILDAVWGYNNEVTSRTVDVHMAWLRKKLGELDSPRHLHTIRRGGYKFQP